jgi:hypothetical protein
MPSSRVIRKLLVALLVMAAFGHLQNPAIAHFDHFASKHSTQFREQAKGPIAARSFVATPSKQKGTSEKRHKRVLISKVFRPETTVIFLKKYRVIESFTDYSSPHVLKRAIVVSSLRGPPLS